MHLLESSVFRFNMMIADHNNGGAPTYIKTEGGLEVSGAPGGLMGEEPTNEGQQLLDTFWQRCMEDCINLNPNTDFKVQELPLARIKKIMKLDEDVKMISAEAPIIFAKACELFVAELTTRAWVHTEESKRRTLQKNDIAMAVSKYDMFDFLIDIVPREEIKPTTKRVGGGPGDQVQYLVQLPASALNGSTGQPITLNLGGQQILINTGGQDETTAAGGVQSQGAVAVGGQSGNSAAQMLQIPLNQIMYAANGDGQPQSQPGAPGHTAQLTSDASGLPVILQSQLTNASFYTQDNPES